MKTETLCPDIVCDHSIAERPRYYARKGKPPNAGNDGPAFAAWRREAGRRVSSIHIP